MLPKERKAAKKAAPKKAAKKIAPAKRRSPAGMTNKAAKPGSFEDLLQELSARQAVFVLEYFAGKLNATHAAIAAGYSEKTAASQASRLLKDVKVAACIKARTKTELAKREITAQGVLDELAKLAFFDPRKFFTPDGGLVPIHELSDECGAALAGMDVKELYQDKAPVGQLKKIKFTDKRAALESLGKHFRLFTDQLEVSHKIVKVVVREELKKPRTLPPAKPDFPDGGK